MKIIIVGGVAGGMSAATRLRRLMEDAEITISHTLNQIETIGDNFCDRTDNPTIDDPDQGQHPPFLYRKNSHKGQEEEGK